MTSRLDRLFILLESGSSAVTRRAAAKQIGEVQKLYPHELHALLNRLVGYLHNPSWETRIAAAQTIEEILKYVPPWQPDLYKIPAAAATTAGAVQQIKKESSPTKAAADNSSQALVIAIPPTAAGEDDCSNGSHVSSSATSNAGDCINGSRLLAFNDFDLEQVLQKGARLIGSEGAEFDLQEDSYLSSVLVGTGRKFSNGNTAGAPNATATAADERLSQQRTMLKEKLGLAQASLGVNLCDMITDEDLMQPTHNYNANEQKVPVEQLLQINKISPNGKPLSCRELNRAKRKARQIAAAAATTSAAAGSCSNAAATASVASTSSPSSLKSSLSRRNSAISANGDEVEKKKTKLSEMYRQEIFYGLNDPVPDATGNWVDAVSWPLENFCARLYMDLFNAKWEIRHGAATALRELINNNVEGAGKNIYMSKEEMIESHNRWLEDAALRLLCVLCLDRFGDFVSDQVVAPVRETCAQVLGTLVKELAADKVAKIVHILIQLVKHKNEWEVRHGGLLGLKYVFVVREELLAIYLPPTINDILQGLFDDVDDVGAVAASTLIPVASWLPKLLSASEVSAIVKTLWDLLLEQDELASACNSFMGLLAAILCLPDASSWIQMESMSNLVPRLWPFLYHSTTSVRKSTLLTLKTLTSNNIKKEERPSLVASNGNGVSTTGILNLDTKNLKLNFGVIEWNAELLQQALRHIYQRILVEPQASVQAMACTVWSNLLKNADIGVLLRAACPYVSAWICLAMQPAKLAFDPASLLQPHNHAATATSTQTKRRIQRIGEDLGNANLTATQRYFLGGSESTPLEVREANYMRARVMASRALGELSEYLVKPAPGVVYATASPTDIYVNVLVGYLDSRSALQRTVCSLIIAFWALNDASARPGSTILQHKLHNCLTEYFYYDEIGFALTRLVQETQDFIGVLKKYNIPVNDFNNSKIYSLEQVEVVANTECDNWSTLGLRSKFIESLMERRLGLQTSHQQTAAEQLAHHNCVQASLAGAISALHCLPEKLNPIVKPLMESIKREDCLLLQELSAEFLVHLLGQLCDRNPSPNNKILNNLCTLLSSDAEYTPKIATIKQTLQDTSVPLNASTECVYYGILTLSLQQNATNYNSNVRQMTLAGVSTATVSRGPGRPSANAVPLADTVNSQSKELENNQCRIQRLGSSCVITKLCSTFGAELITKFPIIEQIIFNKIKEFLTKNTCMLELGKVMPDLGQSYELITSLQLIETAAPHLHVSLHERLFELLPDLGVIVTHPLKSVRHMAARCIATLATIDTCRTMDYVINHLLSLLPKIEQIIERQGAMEAIENVVNKLQIKIVPYIVLMVVPLLGCMSDPDEYVRLLATHCFATLVQLMPLDSQNGKCKKEFKSEELQARSTRDREFLDYLFAPKTIPDYKVPVTLSVELRSYQQAGVNWLWFLNKYNLHGILCDDMGLGKTLQTICILAGDHYQRTIDKEASLPSLVICPPTLTGHWVYEIEKFLQKSKVLRPLHYVGLPAGREKLRWRITGKHCNLIVASYDTVRKDIDFLNTIHWNYCVLDEGHIIKNGKTKSSKAIKNLKAKHRLILSGTPIQNNVLELWSLFDFLMPGFLGTEKQFIARYSRPILASRDAKSSSKEQEAGVLAMEALHRQVLPFLLRRVKKDVLTDLPPKITQDLLCELSPLQLRLYEDFSNKHLKDCLDKMGDTQNLDTKTHIFQALRYLQNVCNHPKLVLKNASQFSKVVADMPMQCKHLDDIENAAKLPALKQLLLDCGIGVQTESVSQHRALIFCQLKAMLDIVENDLLRKHLPTVTYLRLDGSVPASMRQDIVNNFNSDPSIDVLLLTTLVGGLGLNLTGADTVIFVEHDWNPMKDLQAMDRAHRIGQKKVVNVYRLITRNSLEEKIMGLQKFKIITANTVVSSENASMETMGTSEIFDLFSLKNGKDAVEAGTSSSSSTTAGGSGHMSKNSFIENLPELWSEHQYDEEYDLTNFMQTLKKK